MSDVSPEAIIAEHVFHFASTGPHWCSCGENISREGSAYGLHLLSRLRDAGHTIVPSVEPTDTKDYSEEGNGEDFLGWEVHEGPYFVSVYDEGEVQVSYDGNVAEPLSSEYARDLGLALLAAAAAASPTAQEES